MGQNGGVVDGLLRLQRIEYAMMRLTFMPSEQTRQIKEILDGKRDDEVLAANR